MKATRYITVILIAIFIFSSSKIIFGQTSSIDEGPIPRWEIGFWWVTESHLLMDHTLFGSGPEELIDVLFYYKWIIVGEEKVKDDSCWIVEIHAYNLPDDVKNDHGDNYLYRLHLRKRNLTLAVFESNLRGGNYLVTGKIDVEYGVIKEEYERGEPIIESSVTALCPLVFPRIPNYWYKNGMLERDKLDSYTDERSGLEITQRTDPFLLNPKNKYFDAEVLRRTDPFLQKTVNDYEPVIYITLNEYEILYIQTWLPGYPWWAEYRCFSEKGKICNLWYSKTIDWKGKQQDK